MTKSRRLRLVLLVLVALLPQEMKQWTYRHLLGYRIGQGVRIGVSLLDASECEIGDHTVIGHGNAVLGVQRFVAGDHVRIGFLNLFRGGRSIEIGRYAEVIRRNEINSIPDAETVTEADPSLTIGAGAVITDGHRIDFTDRVTIGRRAIIGGRNSSLWTHNRQQTSPVTVGDLAYLGSEVRMAPGSSVPGRCIVGIGAVVTECFSDVGPSLLGGVPTRRIQELDDLQLRMVERPTRRDLPEDL